MTEKEMLDSLQKVWENMTMDKDSEAYKEMLQLLDNMVYYLRYDLQCEYRTWIPRTIAEAIDEFDF